MDGRNSPVDLTEETFMEAIRAGTGSPLRQRMITGHGAGWTGITDPAELYRCGASTGRALPALPGSAQRRGSARLSAWPDGIGVRRAAPSRSCITASSSCTARRLIVTECRDETARVLGPASEHCRGNAAPGREVLKASEQALAPPARQKHKH